MTELEYKLFFKAFSNKTRFEIIKLLKKGPKNVTEICAELGFKQSRVSRNLKCLVNCGFVSVTQDGKKRIYSLDTKTVQPILDIIDKHIKKYRKRLIECEVLEK